jgi:hypothetical protein
MTTLRPAPLAGSATAALPRRIPRGFASRSGAGARDGARWRASNSARARRSHARPRRVDTRASGSYAVSSRRGCGTRAATETRRTRKHFFHQTEHCRGARWSALVVGGFSLITRLAASYRRRCRPERAVSLPRCTRSVQYPRLLRWRSHTSVGSPRSLLAGIGHSGYRLERLGGSPRLSSGA